MKRIVSLLFIMVWSAICIAQKPTYYLDPNKQLSEYNFESWSTEQGLPSNSLLHIFQSRNGYLWISGYNGLIRFDGYQFHIFNTQNTSILKSNVIRRIAEDSESNLWITTQGSGLVKYANGTFQSYGIEEGITQLHRGLYVDKNNRVWSASPEKGWFWFEDDIFHFIESTFPLASYEVRAITQTSDETVWFATLGQGLFRYNRGVLKQIGLDDGLLNQWIYCLHTDEDENIWAGTNQGVFKYDGSHCTRVFPQIETQVSQIQRDRYGNLWIGTIEGLYRFNQSKNTLEYISSEKGLPNDYIVDFLFDFEGNFWITHYKGGLSKIKDGKFTNLTQNSGLPGKVVNTICEIDNNKFLIGFDNGGLVTLSDGILSPFKTRSNLDAIRIRHIFRDKDNGLWISSYSGLLRITPKGEEKWYVTKNGFPATLIRLAYQDSKGRIWIGTRNNGVILFDEKGNHKVFDIKSGLSANLIMSIDEDAQGNLLIGTSEGESGLSVIRTDFTVKAFTRSDGFLSNVVFNIYTDKEGNDWIATNDGLFLKQGDKFTLFSSRQGMADDSPFDVIEDDFGYLWMPYSKGIMKVRKQQFLLFAKGEVSQIDCTIIDKHDGMKQAECNPTAQSTKSSDGLFFIPTIDGIAITDPSNVMVNNYIPPVIIESIAVDSLQFDSFSPLTLSPGHKRYTFHYTALSLYEPEKIHFRYKLEGFDSEWVNTGNTRTVSYTNLKHGNYKFRVTACNNDGIWNDTGAELSFTIKPRFTETILFYILVMLTVFTVFTIIYSTRLLRLKKRQIELQNTIKESASEILNKNRELELQRDEIELKNRQLEIRKSEIEAQATELQKQQDVLKALNISKDRLLSVIAHDLRTPIGNISNLLDMINAQNDYLSEEKKKRLMTNLSDVTKSTYDLIENLLEWSKAQHGLITYNPVRLFILPVINEVINLLHYAAEKKHIAITIQIEETTLVYADANMTRTVFRNLVANAIKFSRDNGEVKIVSELRDGMVLFSVHDKGKGMNLQQMEYLFVEIDKSGTQTAGNSGLGLILCKEFVEMNGGEIWATSVVGEGSIFYFSLPVAQ